VVRKVFCYNCDLGVPVRHVLGATIFCSARGKTMRIRRVKRGVDCSRYVPLEGLDVTAVGPVELESRVNRNCV